MLDALREREAAKLLISRRHPSAPLTIWNYTARCQYEYAWDEVTLAARGLILDDAGQIVARGFRKFFNLSEHPGALPETPFRVLDKLDGSLGILYVADDGLPAIATRGSFDNAQAILATTLLRERYPDYRSPAGATAVFEIIYPENRVVVDYGATCDLFHLGLVDNATGLVRFELDPAWPGPRTREFDPAPPSELVKILRPNAEGFVVRYACGFQVKVKLEEYVRIHKSMFQTSTKTIWERLAHGATAEEIVAHMPDEVMPFVRQCITTLHAEFARIEEQCKADFAELAPFAAAGRGAFAGHAKTRRWPAVLFSMLDGKSYAHTIWRAIEPEWKPAREMIAEDVA